MNDGAAALYPEDFIDTDRMIDTLEMEPIEAVEEDGEDSRSLSTIVFDLATTARRISRHARAATTACLRRRMGQDDGARAG
jgi:hypothetical protein